MVKITEALAFHNETAKKYGLKEALGDPFLCQHIPVYKKICQLEKKKFLITNNHVAFGWPELKVIDRNPGQPHIVIFNNRLALEKLLSELDQYAGHFDISHLRYVDLLGNTILAETIIERIFAKEKINQNDEMLKLYYAQIVVFAMELYISSFCYSSLSKWYLSLNIYYRSLCEIRDELYVVNHSLNDFLDICIYEMESLIKNDLSFSQKVHPLIKEAFEVTGFKVFNILKRIERLQNQKVEFDNICRIHETLFCQIFEMGDD